MSFVALYIVFGISLAGTVLLSLLVSCTRTRARQPRDLEMSTTRQSSLTCLSSLTHLSSLTQITAGDFDYPYLLAHSHRTSCYPRLPLDFRIYASLSTSRAPRIAFHGGCQDVAILG
jgi:hypothetical protein